MKISRNSIVLLRAVCLLFLFELISCSGKSTNNRESAPKVFKRTSEGLSLNKATLEQSNNQGQPLWKIEVKKANYSLDHKKVIVKDIKGNFFQDGRRVLEIAAKDGEVYKNGEEIYIRNSVVAVDPRNNIRIDADEMKWQPKADLLTITKRFNAIHLGFQVSADQAIYRSRHQELELTGNILAFSKKPDIELKTEHLKWLISQHKMIGDKPLEFIRYQGTSITDQLNSKQMEIDTTNNTILSKDTLNFKSTHPTTQITGNNFLWNYRERHFQSQQTAQLYDYSQQVTFTANGTDYDQNKGLAHFKGGVHGLSSRNQTQIYSQQAIWYIKNKKVDATGNIIYKQNNPKMQLTGDRAVGTLQTNQIVVTSQNGNKVVTQIYIKHNP